MSSEWLYTIAFFAWLIGATCFVLGLHMMNSPATARKGNQLSAAGMAVAVITTAVWLALDPDHGLDITAWAIIIVGFAIGGGIGFVFARRVKMTAMPQLVSMFNAVGGGAAALVALDDYLRIVGTSEESISTSVFVVLGVLIGCVTFTGSIVAAGKLQGLISGKPIKVPGGQMTTLALAIVAVVGLLLLVFGAGEGTVLTGMGDGLKTFIVFVILLAACTFGVTMVLPIGGADMPVVISLLNSFTGTAAAMSGFVLGNPVLIIAGALVGASGAILTKLMADAMNRSILNIMIGGFGEAGSPIELIHAPHEASEYGIHRWSRFERIDD